MSVKKHIAIPEEEFNELCEDQALLHALQAGGVDNWEGYEIALDMMEEN